MLPLFVRCLCNDATYCICYTVLLNGKVIINNEVTGMQKEAALSCFGGTNHKICLRTQEKHGIYIFLLVRETKFHANIKQQIIL
jgi:hypothetical protein